MRPTRYRVEHLSNHHDRKSFSCGRDELDRYFKEFAGQDVKRNLSTVRVMIDTQNQDRIVGFYTLSSTGVPTTDFPAEIQKKIPYKLVPGTLLGRLAIDVSYQGQGLGRLLLADALQYAAMNRNKIASAFVVVDAKDTKAKEFYDAFGFLAFPSNPLRPYMHMKTIEKAIAESQGRESRQ